MSFIGLEISGVEGLLQDFKGFKKEAEIAINKAVSDTSRAIETDAKNRLRDCNHVVFGNLLRSIYNRVIQSMEKIVGTNVYYAPYIEFGTGDLVEIPEGTEEVAIQFKGKGIRKVNIKGDSFLNWAAVNQSKKLVDRIENNLNKIIR